MGDDGMMNQRMNSSMTFRDNVKVKGAFQPFEQMTVNRFMNMKMNIFIV